MRKVIAATFLFLSYVFFIQNQEELGDYAKVASEFLSLYNSSDCSGNTTEPHLHLSLQNDIEMNTSMGAKLYFSKIVVSGEMKEDYLSVKEYIIKNIN